MALTTVPSSLSATAITLTTAAQPNITSVGTLTGLTVSGNIAGTLTTAAQTNITSVGTLSALTISGGVAISNDAASLTIQNSSADTGQRFRRNANNDLILDRIASGSTAETMRLTATGNVGIGTGSPDATIHGAATQASGDVPFIFENAGTSGVVTASLVFAGNGGGGAEKARIKSAVYGDGYMAFHTNDDSEKMRINSSGNVGIGTISPSALLHIASTGASNIKLEDTDNGFAATELNVENGGRDFKITTPQDTIFVQGSTEALRILNGGNVGIGTSSPQALLHLNSNTDTYFIVGTTNATADGRIQFRNSAGTDAGGLWYNTSGNRMMFRTNSLERMRIDSSGELTLGNPSGGSALQLDVSATGTDGVDIKSTYYSGGYGPMKFKTSNSTRLTLETNGNSIFQGNNHTNLQVKAGDNSTVAFLQTVQGSDARFGTSSNHPLNISTNGQFRMTLNTSGDVDIVDGDLKFAAGHGVSFINANDTATGETVSSSVLDDYEEGTYAVSITSQNGTMTLQSGYDTLSYTRIGRQVTINGRIRFNTVSGASGFVKVNVPFTSVNYGGQGDYAYFSTAGHNVNVAADIYGVFGEMGPNVNLVLLLQKIDNGAWNYWDASGFSNGDYLYLAGTYFTP